MLNCPVVSVDWLHKTIDQTNLVLLNASIPKVTSNEEIKEELYIPNSQFFDIKTKFSDVNGIFPNTVPSQQQFEKEARDLGVNNDSIIVVYDDKGIYSSARAWWLFKAFGFNKVYVLDGGLPEWKAKGLILTDKYVTKAKGNYVAKYNPKLFKFYTDIVRLIDDMECQILDARSSNRFHGLVAEPRKGLRSGNIPNSKSLPYTELFNGNLLKSKAELELIFNSLADGKSKFVFTCGSGITACVLALAAKIVGLENISVYDGSWTEYGSLTP